MLKVVRAEIRVDSGAWNAGEREGIIEGVRIRMEGLGVGCGVEECVGCDSGREVRSGRKVCKVRIGVRRRVFRRSLRIAGASVAIGDVGYVVEGIMINDRRTR